MCFERCGAARLSVSWRLLPVQKDRHVPNLRRSSFHLPLLFAACLSLSACGGPTALQQALRPLPERVELTDVPAFPERAYQGAPTALASLLVQQGVDTSPGLLAKALQLPGAEDRLQQNMLTQINSYGLLAYPLQPNLQALLEQVAAGLPVLLRFNEGLAWVDMPRYAVLVGYDRAEQTLLLRAGNSRRWQTSFSSFDSAWHSAGAWAVLVLAPVQLPAKVDAQRWSQAADEVARAGHKEAAANARRALQRGTSQQ